MPAAANVVPIDELFWTATRYSDVLKLDRRVVAQALEAAPSSLRNNTRVWHVRDGMPAIFRPEARRNDPNQMEPKEALDFYRAKREQLRLGEDLKQLVKAADVEQAIGAAFKSLSQSLDAIPDALERDCGLSPAAVISAQQLVDSMREHLYQSLLVALNGSAAND